MDFQELYVLKYKKGPVGPQTAFILASSDKRAEDVGKAYCGTIPGCRYITAFKAVLATEDILGDPIPDTDRSKTVSFPHPDRSTGPRETLGPTA